tara:strand:+ start:367 stop:543 length:177 start_codon:yes stop_codon:yes gene_type:complete
MGLGAGTVGSVDLLLSVSFIRILLTFIYANAMWGYIVIEKPPTVYTVEGSHYWRTVIG